MDGGGTLTCVSLLVDSSKGPRMMLKTKNTKTSAAKIPTNKTLSLNQ